MAKPRTTDASVLEHVVDATSAKGTLTTSNAAPAAYVAKLVGVSPDGTPVVRVDESVCGIPARSCVVLGSDDIDRDVVVVYEGGSREKPIIMGVIRRPGDSRTIVLAADESITLRCGQSSLTLSDDRVVVRGLHVVTHASGVNRIRGGSVQIN
jgi:hypothetical protein